MSVRFTVQTAIRVCGSMMMRLREQIELFLGPVWFFDTEMPVDEIGDLAAPRRALEETLLDEVRLVNLLEGARFLSDGDRDRGEAHRPPAIFLCDRKQDPLVHLVEAVFVHLEFPQGVLGHLGGDFSVRMSEGFVRL